MVIPIVVPRKLPRITIDQEKCTVPFLCKKCLRACPMAVFRLRNDMTKVERQKELDPRIPGNYVVSAYYRNKCTVCNQCLEVCPVGAIKIEAP